MEPELSRAYKHNQGMMIAERLVDHWRFEHRPGKPFIRVVDEQHAMVVSEPGRRYLTSGDEPMRTGLSLGLARRDINETEGAWLHLEAPDPWRWTVLETSGDRFFPEAKGRAAQRPLSWPRSVPFDAIRSELDEAVTSLLAWANFSQIEALLYDPEKWHRYQFRRVVNAALAGDAERYRPDLDRMIALAAEEEPSSPYSRNVDAFAKHVQLFIADHPSGTR